MRRNSIRLVVTGVLALSSLCAQTVGERPIHLPVVDDEDRFYVAPVTQDGVAMKFFSDTGGRLFVFSDVADRSQLQVSKGEGGASAAASLPEFKSVSLDPAPRRE